MLRTSLLVSSALLAASALVRTGAQESPAAPDADAPRRPPNVLFIAIDDLRTDLGCMGVPYAATPRIDQLAAEGALFTRHYAAVPTCGASRYALLTGRAPRVSGVVAGNDSFERGAGRLRAAPDDGEARGAQSLPELFRSGGYETVLVGKLSHTPDGRLFAYDGSGDGRPELPEAWDVLATPFGPWGRGWGAFFAYPGGLHREDGGGHARLTDFTAESDEDLPDGLLATAAIEQLARLKRGDSPFFLALGLFKPHLPFVAPRADRAAFADVAVPPAVSSEGMASRYLRASGEFHRYVGEHARGATLSADEALEVRRAYLACVRYTDRQVGRVLDALAELGLADDTLVVLWSDHGWLLGEHGLWGKHSPFERALHSPLIVRAPGVTEPGTRIDALVEATDLYPTLVALCGLGEQPTRWPLDGASLVPLLTGEAERVRDTAESRWGEVVSVRDATHRLIARVRDGIARDVELYDLGRGDDPSEDCAAAAPEHVAALLRALGVSRAAPR